ncbi:MAG TPA: hypothetical protein VE984_03285 [Gaiellaceae bacterium]|nr:hypothetical protein [Gaiellaceae bacterium]
MKRFLMLVAVAVVAASMYVAASPAGPQASGPTARQFKALQKQVKTLSKDLKKLKTDESQVKKAANAAVLYIGACFFVPNTSTIASLPVSQFGSASAGFLFGTSAAAATPRTALDVNTSTPSAHLQEVNAACVSGSSTALRHDTGRVAGTRLRLWAQRGR